MLQCPVGWVLLAIVQSASVEQVAAAEEEAAAAAAVVVVEEEEEEDRPAATRVLAKKGEWAGPCDRLEREKEEDASSCSYEEESYEEESYEESYEEEEEMEEEEESTARIAR